MLVKERYKLMYYSGYEDLPGGSPYVELYDFIDDPQEMHDLSQQMPDLVQEMIHEIEQQINKANFLNK